MILGSTELFLEFDTPPADGKFDDDELDNEPGSGVVGVVGTSSRPTLADDCSRDSGVSTDTKDDRRDDDDDREGDEEIEVEDDDEEVDETGNVDAIGESGNHCCVSPGFEGDNRWLVSLLPVPVSQQSDRKVCGIGVVGVVGQFSPSEARPQG